MSRLTLKVKQNCEGNVCPMPLGIVVKTINGLELIGYDEKMGIAEFEYDTELLSKETIVAKLKEKKYNITIKSPI